MSDTQNRVADAQQKSWVYRYLPEQFWPFAQLARWERPIGWKLLMWPCWWSLALAFAYYKPVTSSVTAEYKYPGNLAYLHQPIMSGFDFGTLNPILWSLVYLLLFTLGAFVMRGAGCTYNDLVDQEIDGKIARTRSRPLPSGRVSRRDAWVFLALQLVMGLLVLLQFNPTTIFVGLVSVMTIIIYPFMKRITWWPQLFLGLAFSWGALLGWTAFGGALHLPAIILYLGCIFWVIGYDTIYAHQDIEDDRLVGVKSTARLFGENMRLALIGLYAAAFCLFAFSFYLTHISWPGWLALLGVAAHMVWQITKFEFDNPALCLALFKSNSILGWILFTGLTISGFVG